MLSPWRYTVLQSRYTEHRNRYTEQWAGHARHRQAAYKWAGEGRDQWGINATTKEVMKGLQAPTPLIHFVIGKIYVYQCYKSGEGVEIVD